MSLKTRGENMQTEGKMQTTDYLSILYTDYFHYRVFIVNRIFQANRCESWHSG